MKATKSKPATPPVIDAADSQPLKGSDRLMKDDKDSERPERPRANNDNNTDLLLTMIHELMETRLRSAAEDREKADVDEEIKNDWMLAAAVVDRILFITFSFLFVGSTSLFFTVFLLFP